jgi:hypothetical protein
MFENITKAIVISSSHLKGVGPRIGSVGYVSNIIEAGRSQSRLLPQITQFINGIVVYSTRVAFIRYGYEKSRPKYEVKTILAIMPIVNENRKLDKTEHIIRTFIDKFPKNNFNSHIWLKMKLDMLNRTDNIDVCIIVPLKDYKSDLRTCSELEFTAWIKSFLYTEQTRINIYRVLHNVNALNKLTDPELQEPAVKLRDIFRSAQKEDDLINFLATTPKSRVDYIRLLMSLNAIYSNKSIIAQKSRMSRLLLAERFNFKKGSRNMNDLICRLTDHMFIDDIFSWKMNVLKESRNVKNNKAIANRLALTKEVMLKMSEEFNKK